MTIAEFKLQVDILALANEYTSMKRSGKSYVGCCPIHNERTPSFHVYENEGKFKCFGCGAGGDAIDLVMQVEEHTSFSESLKTIAEKQKIQLPEFELTEKEKELNLFHNANKFAQNKFVSQLSQEHIDLMAERNIKLETLQKFNVGFAPNQWEFLKTAVNGNYERMIKLGNLVQNENGKVYDRFRNRIMFPFTNIKGQTIGFSGRTLSQEKNEAKYLNSIDSELFNKSYALFGIYQAIKAIKVSESVVVVEGQTDVLSMHQAGICNTVATSGTSFTDLHVQRLKKYTTKVCLCFDNDNAGLIALHKAAIALLTNDFDVYVCFLPEKYDPNKFSEIYGDAALKKYFTENTKEYFAFTIEYILAANYADYTVRSKKIMNLLKDANLITNEIKRNEVLKLISVKFETPMESILKQVELLPPPPKPKIYEGTNETPLIVKSEFVFTQAEINAIKLLLYCSGEKYIVNEPFEVYYFSELEDAEQNFSPNFKIVYNHAKSYAEIGQIITIESLLEIENESIATALLPLKKCDFSINKGENFEKSFEIIVRLKLEIVTNMLKQRAKNLQENTENVNINDYISEFQKIKEVHVYLQNLIIP